MLQITLCQTILNYNIRQVGGTGVICAWAKGELSQTITSYYNKQNLITSLWKYAYQCKPRHLICLILGQYNFYIAT